MKNNSWKKIFEDLNLNSHNFDKSPYYISAEEIKVSCQNFKKQQKKKREYYANKINVKKDLIFLKRMTFSYYL